MRQAATHDESKCFDALTTGGRGAVSLVGRRGRGSGEGLALVLVLAVLCVQPCVCPPILHPHSSEGDLVEMKREWRIHRPDPLAAKSDSSPLALSTDMAPGGVKFDHAQAAYLLNLSRATYCDLRLIANWTCPVCVDDSVSGFKPYFVNPETSAHVGVYVGYDFKKDMIVTAFRGTLYLINWIQDLNYYKIDAEYKECSTNKTSAAKNRCMVHSGFYTDWLSVKNNVLVTVQSILQEHPNASIWVTGHSLGGAMAAFCALELSLTLNRTDVGAYTFGEPRVGNADFADFWGDRVPNGVRLVHQDDVVPHLPPRGKTLFLLTDFHHTRTEVWQTGTMDNEFKVCAPSGEDPKCSNSLPEWDRSVEAHLFYMGWSLHCF